MAQEYQTDDEELDFRQSRGGKAIKVVGIIVFVAIILAYALQTLQLVGWLFPDNNWFMQVVTVFVCDGCATGYAMAEMFYRFRLRASKDFVFWMWIITFIFSTAASVIQMYLGSTHNIPHDIDPKIISIAYGVVIAAFVINIVAITLIIRMEHNSAQPVRRYMDDKPKKRVQQPRGRSDVRDFGTPEVEPVTSPLATAPLDTTQASQPSQNGHAR